MVSRDDQHRNVLLVQLPQNGHQFLMTGSLPGQCQIPAQNHQIRPFFLHILHKGVHHLPAIQKNSAIASVGHLDEALAAFSRQLLCQIVHVCGNDYLIERFILPFSLFTVFFFCLLRFIPALLFRCLALQRLLTAVRALLLSRNSTLTSTLRLRRLNSRRLCLVLASGSKQTEPGYCRSQRCFSFPHMYIPLLSASSLCRLSELPAHP